MWDPETRTLLRRFRDGQAAIEAYAEDFAFLIFGLLELFQADPDPEWLRFALALQERQDELFWDNDEGGWFSSSGRDPSVLVRMKDDYDGAEPSASSVSVLNLLLLTHLAENREWSDRVDRTLRLFGDRLQRYGRGVPMMGAALSTYLAGSQQIVIVSPGNEAEGAADLRRTVSRRYLPFAVVLFLDPAGQRALASMVPWLSAMTPVNGAAAAYVCADFTCRRPVTSVQALESELTNA
jgi:uncharacterized protein YyaL (SSP411 family)